MMHVEHPMLLLLAVPAGLAYRHWFRAAGARGLLRVSLLAILVIMAAGPATRARGGGSTLVLVIDRSRSMPPTLDLAKRANAERRPDDRLAIVGFGAEPTVERQFDSAQPERGLDADQSNLHAAIAAALELVPAGEPARILIESDGVSDDPLSDALADELRSRGVPIDFYHHARSLQGDVVLDAVTGPETAEPGSEVVFQLHTVLHAASAGVRATLRVRRDNQELAAQPVQVPVGRSQFEWRGRAESRGVNLYRFELEVPGDPIPENNAWDSLLTVSGTPEIVVLNEAGTDTPLVQILRRGGLSVAAEQAGAAPVTLEWLGGSQACVLEDVPADAIGPAGLQNIARYVEHLGGGLVVTGGSRSFGIGGYRLSPLEPLLPVELRSLAAGQRPPLAVVVLIVSGSWDIPSERLGWPGTPDKSPLQIGMVELTQSLASADALGIVTMEILEANPFARVGPTDLGDPVVLPLTNAGQRQNVRQAIERLGPTAQRLFMPTVVSAAVKLIQPAAQPAKHLVVLADAHQVSDLVGLVTEQLGKTSALDGVSVTILARGSASGRAGGEQPTRIRAGLRIVNDVDADDLGPELAEDIHRRTGGGFVDRELGVRPPGAVEATGDPAGWPALVRGFHEAGLRKDATATLVADGDLERPLAAQWTRGTGRVGAVLFAVPRSGEATIASEALDSLVARMVRWAARREPQRATAVATIQRSDRTAIVKLDPGDAEASALRDPASLDLVVAGADGTAPSRIERWERHGSELVARFSLDRPQTYFPVVRRGNDVVARCRPIRLPRSSEFMTRLTPDDGRAVLAELASRTGGHEWSWGMPLFGLPAHGPRSLAPVLAWLTLVLLVLDVADRRLGWTETLDAARLRRRRVVPTSEGDAPLEPATDVFKRAKELSRRRMER